MSVPVFPVMKKFHLLKVSDVLTLPSPSWRVQGLLPVGALSMMYAPQEQGKTFLALDLALSIATGEPFHGRTVRQGPVVYVLGEGRGGLKNRIRAWLQTHGLEDTGGIFFVLEAVQFRVRNDGVALHQAIEQLNVKPSFVVVDTFARCAVGVDENDAKDVGEWIEGIRQFQAWNDGVDVMAVHHAQKGGGGNQTVRERGSSAFIGATDTVLRLKRSGKTVTITCEKQKDAEHFRDFTLYLQVVPLGENEFGEPSSSCVLGEGEAPISDAALPGEQLTMLRILNEFPDRTAQRKDWLPNTGLAERTFDRHRGELEAGRYITATDQRPGSYQLTVLGTLAIANESPADRPGDATTVAATPHP